MSAVLKTRLDAALPGFTARTLAGTGSLEDVARWLQAVDHQALWITVQTLQALHYEKERIMAAYIMYVDSRLSR